MTLGIYDRIMNPHNFTLSNLRPQGNAPKKGTGSVEMIKSYSVYFGSKSTSTALYGRRYFCIIAFWTFYKLCQINKVSQFLVIEEGYYLHESP